MVAKPASEYGVHMTQLHGWRKECVEMLPKTFAREASLGRRPSKKNTRLALKEFQRLVDKGGDL